ncbi:unnamed protein product [Paramecium sonneborni]|uniref:Uncharacterized protein n=1 Tax=Paramecium sonneborni TaxID=65129 RepID=A0A8S1RQE9_9CILI|nr:unnamed protein product [Paramecium sonneborni]
MVNSSKLQFNLPSEQKINKDDIHHQPQFNELNGKEEKINFNFNHLANRQAKINKDTRDIQVALIKYQIVIISQMDSNHKSTQNKLLLYLSLFQMKMRNNKQNNWKTQKKKYHKQLRHQYQNKKFGEVIRQHMYYDIIRSFL